MPPNLYGTKPDLLTWPEWCCSSEEEVCPPQQNLNNTCIPKNYLNPARNGPLWGSNAIASPTSIPTAASGPTEGTNNPAHTPPVSPAQSPPLPLGAAAALGAVGVLVLVALVYGVNYFRKRKMRHSHPSQQLGIETVNQELVGVHEIQGESIHELGSGEHR